VITKPETCHICYCHTPTRYYWSHYQEYLKRNHFGLLDPIFKMVMPGMVSKLRLWDRRAADRVDYFIANSGYVKNRIAKYYLRDSEVVHPPVETSRFQPATETGDYFLVVGRQIPYKRTDLAVEAFNQLGLPLWIIGDGPELKNLASFAKPNIHFLGRMSDSEVAQAMSRAQALIFPQEEDFGIVPLEMQSAGRPVIAYGSGGAKETVIDGVTGLFFHEQTVPALIDAVERFREMEFDSQAIVEHAMRFDTKIFKLRLGQAITKAYTEYRLKMGLAPRI
jgi:glycosyltransferase involved in cell wall biosynthesis